MTLKRTDIPEAMRARRAWVLWKQEVREGSDKPTKVPYQVCPSHPRAASDDPGSWGTFDEACSEAAEFSGVGFMAGVGVTGWILIDLDHCFEDGELTQWANDIIVAARSYTEVSPSGQGIHIFANGDMFAKSIKTKKAEIYSERRYFTVTGDVFNGRKELRTLSSDEVEKIRAMIAATRTDPVAEPAQVELPEAMFRARNGSVVKQLWDGAVDPNMRSESDLSLCSHLAFWTKCDRAEMDRLFRRSGLMRKKWDEKHSSDGRTYGEMTVDKAVEGCKEVYSGTAKAPQQNLPSAVAPPPVCASAPLISEFYEHSERFYHHGRDVGISTGWEAIDKLFCIVPGMLYIVTGYPGSGKTEFLFDLSMHLALSKGYRWGLFSPENLPVAATIQNLAEKYLGKAYFGLDRMSVEELRTAHPFINEHYRPIGVHDEGVTLDMILAASLTFPCEGLIVDPWNEIEHTRGPEQTQTEFVGCCLMRLRRYARLHSKVVFLCAHPAKMRRDPKTQLFPVPDLYDISDSAHWRNKADFGIVVYRNEQTNETDIHLRKCRFRYYGKVGKESLRFDTSTGRFLDSASSGTAKGWADSTDF